MIIGDNEVQFNFTVPKFASIARDLLICAVMLGTYLIVGLILFLTGTMNLGSFLLIFVGISVVTAVTCVITLLRQEKTEYFVYLYKIIILSRGREYTLSFSDIEELKLKHCLRDKSKGTIEFIPYEEYRRRGVRFCFKNLPDIDKLYGVLQMLYLLNNSSSLTVSEWLDLNLLDEVIIDDALAFCFHVVPTELKRFNYDVNAGYITTENRKSIAEDYGEELMPPINDFDDWLAFVDDYMFTFMHPFNAQSDEEAYKFIKEEILKYIENGHCSDRLKKCKAIFITDENKFEKIY